MIVRKYKTFFKQMIKFDDLLSKNDRKTFQIFEILIIKTILEKNICFVICTLINVNIIKIKNFRVDYIIIQETARAKNKNVYIVIIQFSVLN